MLHSPKVFLVDVNVRRRDSFRSILTGAGLKVDTFASAADLVEAVRHGTTGCLIVHVPMPGLDGLELQHKLLSIRAVLSIIVVTSSRHAFAVAKAEKVGDVVLLTNPVRAAVLLRHVHDALAATQRGVTAHDQYCQWVIRMGQITPRERELLLHIAKGDATKMIAASLETSERTVAHQRSHLLRKTKCKNTAELVYIGASVGAI